MSAVTTVSVASFTWGQHPMTMAQHGSSQGSLRGSSSTARMLAPDATSGLPGPTILDAISSEDVKLHFSTVVVLHRSTCLPASIPSKPCVARVVCATAPLRCSRLPWRTCIITACDPVATKGKLHRKRNLTHNSMPQKGA